jgi:hypothetical protein
MQIILIEEVHEFPMIDMTLKPFEVIAFNWSKLVSVPLSLYHFVVTNDAVTMSFFLYSYRPMYLSQPTSTTLISKTHTGNL